ncbi:hypothetical protein GF323_06475 [Candidatus Woesearchaeota archaeon]|nr:hypothetical protein [Candidatus Woesearchaeota archaeon]
MAFSKTFPRTVKGSNYPVWEEIYLTDEEEKEEDLKSRKENIRLLQESIEDAKGIMKRKGLKEFQTDMINISLALFEKRASHSVYWKENRAKKKFDKKFSL